MSAPASLLLVGALVIGCGSSSSPPAAVDAGPADRPVLEAAAALEAAGAVEARVGVDASAAPEAGPEADGAGPDAPAADAPVGPATISVMLGDNPAIVKATREAFLA